MLLLVAWVFYLSLYKVGQTFLSFQWDLLLLETGLLAIFFAPWKLLPRLSTEPPPPRVVLWLIRWLVFRLMFCSGVVKLLDENPANPTWYQLTALTYHYETQCIPNAIAWYAHQLPLWFQKFSVVCMFIIEIGVPFLIFLARRPRALAFFALLFLQLLIILTGNYNFFNLLTIAMCFMLLDDACLERWFPRRMVENGAPRRDRLGIGRLQRLSIGVLAIVVLSVSGIWMVETFVGFRELPPAGQEVLRYSMRFGSINNYGLFRSMTTKRPEIIVEGSNDRRTWLAYEFKWKPGDLSRRPGFVAPHQPRLDWQMWFAALGDFHYARNRWFAAFEKRLLEGKPEVLALLDTNPFADGPPRWVRAVLYDYHFTDADTRREQGTWWTRARLRAYGPVLSLDSFRGR
ncbi:MAG: lipase maturation factor family protein [Planctomycetes bacterium]|nr:lipase maturation factor family protein [Planctomycetota bacterium]